jgi:hypothetical protein
MKEVKYKVNSKEKSIDINENESFRTAKKEISTNRRALIELGKELINT